MERVVEGNESNAHELYKFFFSSNPTWGYWYGYLVLRRKEKGLVSYTFKTEKRKYTQKGYKALMCLVV